MSPAWFWSWKRCRAQYILSDHGDHVIITRSRAGNGGGLIMLGRSDGVLYVYSLSFSSCKPSSGVFRNPGGIRFGSAELYDVIELCFAPANTHAGHTIVDCLAVGQSVAQGSDERVILFVKLLEGQTLTEELEKKIKSEIRTRRSARHVPARVSSFNSCAALKHCKAIVHSRTLPVAIHRSYKSMMSRTRST